MNLSRWIVGRVPFLVATAVALWPGAADADPSNYPQYAQQRMPENVTPEFIGIDQLFADIRAGAKPLIIDVRTAEEFREVHIAGAVSAPLAQFKSYLKSIPRDRPVVLY